MTPNETLTRRRDPHRSECWLIYFGDVHVGSVGRAVGTPGAAEHWVWFCGFYPSRTRASKRMAPPPPSIRPEPTSREHGMVFSSKRTEADYQAWREQRDWTARKYALRDRGEPVPLR